MTSYLLFNLKVWGLPESTTNFLLTMVPNVRALNHAYNLVARVRLPNKNFTTIQESNVKNMLVCKNLLQFNETLKIIRYKKLLSRKDWCVKIDFLVRFASPRVQRWKIWKWRENGWRDKTWLALGHFHWPVRLENMIDFTKCFLQIQTSGYEIRVFLHCVAFINIFWKLRVNFRYDVN